MTVLIGTQHGVFRAASDVLETPERVLESGETLRVRTLENHTGVFAASKSGLYRSVDGGMTWEDLGVPRAEVFSVSGSPDGSRLYAGTHPAHLYVSHDDGATWDESTGFRSLPGRDDWHTPRHRNAARIRSLAVHSDAPNRIIAGVEVGGVHVSDDGGETWDPRRTTPGSELDLQDDVHHLLAIRPETVIAACGEGLFRTRDAGRSWSRLDDEGALTYFRETYHHDGVLYAGVHTRPGTWASGGGPAILAYHLDTETVERVADPAEPSHAFVVAWASADGRILAGTNTGQLLRREDGRLKAAGAVPAGIRSIATLA